VIDIHSHILPGLDDGAENWEEALAMARLAVADGIRTMVATPHLYPHRMVDRDGLNDKHAILDKVEVLKKELSDAGIPLDIVPGCDVPLCQEALRLLDEDLLLTINDNKRYLLLELPDTAFPPATEDICYQLLSKGITPIITHPERHLIIYEMPEKLERLLHLGCLAQLTASSLLGGFGRKVAKFARQLAKQGYIQVVATDSHGPKRRPPVLGKAVAELARLVGPDEARAMVTTIPEMILRGDPVDN
jgi:protein-tyrosine phosphatase